MNVLDQRGRQAVACASPQRAALNLCVLDRVCMPFVKVAHRWGDHAWKCGQHVTAIAVRVSLVGCWQGPLRRRGGCDHVSTLECVPAQFWSAIAQVASDARVDRGVTILGRKAVAETDIKIAEPGAKIGAEFWFSRVLLFFWCCNPAQPMQCVTRPPILNLASKVIEDRPSLAGSAVLERLTFLCRDRVLNRTTQPTHPLHLDVTVRVVVGQRFL